MMLEHKNIMFLDIETVSQHKDFKSAPKDVQDLWQKKVSRQGVDIKDDPNCGYDKTPLYSEFGKIVCISVGFASRIGNKLKFKLKSFCSDDEKQLLEDFASVVNKHMQSNMKNTLCGHNAKSFDFPFIARRMLIHGMQVPGALNTIGKKPWEINLLDTMEIWKFGDFRYYVSLNVLAHAFDVPNPKDDIDGSQVSGVYHNDKDLKRIAVYCEKDVVTTARVFYKMNGMEDVEHVV